MDKVRMETKNSFRAAASVLRNDMSEISMDYFKSAKLPCQLNALA